MSFSKFVLDTANKLRPVLTRIVPAGLLSAVKAKIVEKNTSNLGNVHIEPFDRTIYKDGINLVGNIRGDNGLGQSMRLIADIIDSGNI